MITVCSKFFMCNCSFINSSLCENDLLVNCVWLIDDLLAELIERSRNGLVLAGTELLGGFNFMNSLGSSLHSQEDLWQVLGLTVGDSPLILLRLEGWSLFSSIFSLSGILTFSWLCLLNWCSFWKFFPLEISLVNSFSLICKLKPNDSLDASEIFLNIDKLIHKSKLHLVFFVGQLWVVTHALKEDISLVSSLGGNGLL